MATPRQSRKTRANRPSRLAPGSEALPRSRRSSRRALRSRGLRQARERSIPEDCSGVPREEDLFETPVPGVSSPPSRVAVLPPIGVGSGPQLRRETKAMPGPVAGRMRVRPGPWARARLARRPDRDQAATCCHWVTSTTRTMSEVFAHHFFLLVRKSDSKCSRSGRYAVMTASAPVSSRRALSNAHRRTPGFTPSQ